MMKKLMLLCAANLLAILAFGADDIYYNNKTFSATESTDGNVYIGPSTASEEALVTVKDGATWNSAANIFLGNAPGTSKLVVESGAVLNAKSNGAELRTSIAEKADTEIENRGTMNLYNLFLGGDTRGASVSTFHNYGTLNVDYKFILGQFSGRTNVFHHHKGAVLNAKATGTWRFYVGGEGGYSTMILDDNISVKSKLWMGAGQWSKGNIVLNDEAVMNFDVGDELIVGYSKDTTAKVSMNDNSRITGKAKIFLGNQEGSNGYVVMSNNTVIAVTNSSGFSVSGGTKTKGLLELNDNANLLIGSKLTVAAGSQSYGHLVLRDNSYIDVMNNFDIASGVGSTGIVELCNYTGQLNEFPAYGKAAGSLAVLRLSGTTDYTFPAQANLGEVAGSSGMIEVKDNAILRLSNDYLIHGVVGATGIVSVCDSASLIAAMNRLQIGVDADTTGYLMVKDDAFVSVSNLCVAYHSKAGKQNARGVLEVAGNAVVTNVTALSIGRGTTALGVVNMRGGSIFFDCRYRDGNALVLGDGNDANTPNALIRGWGFLGFDDAKNPMINYEAIFGAGKKWAGMTFSGRIIADGEGVERTLDLSRGPVPSYLVDKYNNCGTNGFYAVNKGKLKFQRSLPRHATNHRQIGIKPDNGSPLMVNGFQYTFDTATMNTLGKYVFSELYAVDRSDIPSGLPTGKGIHHVAVYRIGYFNETATPDVDDEELTDSHKQDFETLKLKFRYDWRIVESLSDKHMIRVYRCTDTVNGGWRRVGSVTPDASSPYVETRTFGASDELWNVGWFAIVAEPKKCTAIIVR